MIGTMNNKDLPIYKEITVQTGLMVKLSSRGDQISEDDPEHLYQQVIIAFDDGVRRKPRQIPVRFRIIRTHAVSPILNEGNNLRCMAEKVTKALHASFGTRFNVKEIHNQGKVYEYKPGERRIK